MRPSSTLATLLATVAAAALVTASVARAQAARGVQPFDASAAHDPAAGTTAPSPIPGRIIVKLRSAAPTPEAEADRILAPLRVRLGIGAITSWLDRRMVQAPPPGSFYKAAPTGNALARILVVTYGASDAPEAVARIVAGLDGVEYAEPVFRRTLFYRPDDAFLGQLWHLEQIGAFDAWDVVRADTSIIIAITDTGVDPEHPDLAGALWRNPGETGTDRSGHDRSTNGVDDDRNGLVDDWRGYDFGGPDGFTPDNDPTPHFWHGSHVAGIAAAIGNNGLGVTGVAFGARLMAVKVTDDASSNDPLLSHGFDGIFYSARMGARIINCSWGGPGFSRAEQEVIDTVTSWGALVVAAAGNNGSNNSAYPACYSGVLSVASLVQSGQRSDFSNFNTHVGLGAPGEAIYSTSLIVNGSNGYRYASGTSMAAPVVSGAAALVAMRYPTLTPEQIAGVLRATADNIDLVNPVYRNLLGSGRVNVARAIAVGPNTVSVMVVSDQIMSKRSDGIVDPGETIEVHVTVRNVLRPLADLRISMSAAGGNVPIETPLAVIGPMASGAEATSQPGIFRLTVPAAIPYDYHLPLDLVLYDGATTIGTQRIDVPVNPNWSTTHYNHTSVTFTGLGRIGYNDFPTSEQGSGFRIDSSRSYLAEGGILIGTASDHLVDVVRGGDGLHQSVGLRITAPYRVAFSAEDNAEVGTATFDDAHLQTGGQVGVDVQLKTLQYGDPDASKITFLLYTLHNRTAEPLHDLHCALFLDWDLGPLGMFDQTSVDLEHRLGYTHNIRDARLPFCGAMTLSNQPMDFEALDNYSQPLASGFYQVEKWTAISSGIQRESSEIGDCSMIVGAGGIDLAPGADTVFAFALMAGANLAELRIAADTARERYRAMGYTPGDPIVLPTELALEEPLPNPFDAGTSLTFAIPRDGVVTFEAYDVAGRNVATIGSGYYTRGTHTMDWRPTDLPSGVYVVQMQAFSQLVVRKLIYMAP